MVLLKPNVSAQHVIFTSECAEGFISPALLAETRKGSRTSTYRLKTTGKQPFSTVYRVSEVTRDGPTLRGKKLKDWLHGEFRRQGWLRGAVLPPIFCFLVNP